jgi:hypothetical protein
VRAFNIFISTLSQLQLTDEGLAMKSRLLLRWFSRAKNKVVLDLKVPEHHNGR